MLELAYGDKGMLTFPRYSHLSPSIFNMHMEKLLTAKAMLDITNCILKPLDASNQTAPPNLFKKASATVKAEYIGGYTLQERVKKLTAVKICHTGNSEISRLFCQLG